MFEIGDVFQYDYGDFPFKVTNYIVNRSFAGIETKNFTLDCSQMWVDAGEYSYNIYDLYTDIFRELPEEF